MKFFYILLIGLLAINTHASTILVDNTNNLGKGSLREAITNASSTDTIRFNPSLIAFRSDTIMLSSEISFNKALTIIGLYNSTDTLYISGGKANRIFSGDLKSAPAGQKYLIIDSMVLVNGEAGGGYGGAINLENGDSLIVSNSTISENKTYTYSGGAGIYSTSPITINHSIISKNNGGYGGGVFSLSTITINYSTISSNISAGNGGGVYSSSLIIINHSKITDNLSLYNGGGIYSSYAIVNYSNISNNRVDYESGGGIYCKKNAIVNYSIINNNDVYKYGGGLFVGDSLIINSSSINKNIGGGIVAKYAKINFSIINENSANDGAGIYAYDSLFVNNSTISKNIAYSNGGGIYNPSSITIINSSIISGNLAKKSGGGIYSLYSFVLINYSTISENTANGDGGGICTRTSVINYSTFNNNISGGKGGGVYCPNATINYTTISENKAIGDGGGIYSFYLTLSYSTISGNIAINGNGGGICCSYSKNPAKIDILSSIVWTDKNGSSNIYKDSSSSVTTSKYNIFSDAPFGTDSTDQINVTLNDLNLQPLSFNGGNNKTMMPNKGSVAINLGIPDTLTNAQNRPIIDSRRDIGAAEYNCRITSKVTKIACETFTWIDGNTYTSSNDTATYLKVSYSSGICDTLFILNLTIPLKTMIDSITACNNYTWRNGINYTKSQSKIVYTLKGVAANGCDSVYILNLKLKSNSSKNIQSACDSFTWGSYTYSSSGIYTQTFINQLGCDSVVTLKLIIKSNKISDSLTICNSYKWDSKIYFKSGVYTQIFQNKFGCDSIVTLTLTINIPDSVYNVQTSCNSFVWGTQTYNKTGVYTQTFQNQLGCDSIVTMALTINKPDSVNYIQSSCYSFLWETQTYNQSGVYTQTFQNKLGCDSIVTLILTINKPDSVNDIQTSCESFAWGTQTYSKSGVYTQSFQNQLGCDSIVTLSLTIQKFPNTTLTLNGKTIIVNEIGASYQWIDCGNAMTIINGETNQSYTPDSIGTFAVIVDNGNCLDTSNCLQISNAGLERNNTLEGIFIYPNPTKRKVTLSSIDNVSSIEVFDIQGKLLLQKNVDLYEIDLSNYENGIYILIIKDYKGNFIIKRLERLD